MSARDATHWDRRYTEQGAPAAEDVALPAVFEPFVAELPTAGTALDIACGIGTATVWLARRGLQTVGYDASPVAIAQAKALARRCDQETRCRFEVVDLDSGLPLGDPVDLVLCNKFRDRRLDESLIARLRPGGVLAICVLSEVGASPGPFRAGPGELTTAFAALEEVASGEADGTAWLLGRRPAGSLRVG